MRQILLFLFIFLSLKSYCQQNLLLPPDSLLKANKVKTIRMRSSKRIGNGSGNNVYYYSKSGNLTKHESMSPISYEPYIITDYFIDSSDKRYASVMHGGESFSSYRSSGSGYSWSTVSPFKDSIVYYYEYNLNNQFKRIYRMNPSGAIMNESLFTYNPKTITSRTYDGEQRVIAETIEYYEREQFITRSVSKKYYSTGELISTFTQDFTNTFNPEGQVTETSYRNDSCACVSKNKYYSNGLIKKRTNIGCAWDKKFTYKYYK